MKHLYALITAFGIEFSPVPYARNHVLPEQLGVTECIDEFYGDDETRGYDVGYDYYADYGNGRPEKEHNNGH